jgi:hypothetical protein
MALDTMFKDSKKYIWDIVSTIVENVSYFIFFQTRSCEETW